MRSNYAAHEAQRAALTPSQWAQPSRCIRRPAPRTHAGLLYLIPLAVAIASAFFGA